MHELMVKSLPQQCRLTAIFDVSQINDMIWRMSTLTMLYSLVILGRFLVRHSLMLVVSSRTISKIFPMLYANSSFQTARSRLDIFHTV